MTGNEKGQLSLPVLAILFLFALFWITYVYWCRQVYWQMRMDVTAAAVALSAARDEAAVLNDMASLQTLENFYLPKMKLGSGDQSAMQVGQIGGFQAINSLLRIAANDFAPSALAVAQLVGKLNGATRPAVPTSPLRHLLSPRSVRIHYFYGPYQVGVGNYPGAYYARGDDWFPNQSHPQPPHATKWIVCHDSICGTGRAGLWLDDRSTSANNGGFPSEKVSGWKALGIQCLLPQFNARLLSTQGGS